MLIDEVDITKIELNQVILITLDAYEKEVFEAKISKIYPTKNERTQTFKIEGVFTNRPKKLYPGLTGEANIVINTKNNVITVPNEYINENSELKTDKGLIKVVTGIKNLERIEIVSGIDSSTLIYKLN
jgi:multidrug efflux pump subunit AcrA (membrane-fusion protein)